MKKSRDKRYYRMPQRCPTVTSGVPQGIHVSPILIIFQNSSPNPLLFPINWLFFQSFVLCFTQCRELFLADPIEHRVGHL